MVRCGCGAKLSKEKTSRRVEIKSKNPGTLKYDAVGHECPSCGEHVSVGSDAFAALESYDNAVKEKKLKKQVV